MRAIHRSTLVQSFHMPVDMLFPYGPFQELTHSHYSWQSGIGITEAERAVAGSGEYPAVDERVALNGKCLRVAQMCSAVVAPLCLPENPLVTLEA
jgi:hypothetical protein